MPDLREVFEMVKQQTEPDVDSWVEQERRMRRTQRKQKIGAFALVAAIAVAAFVFVLYDSDDDQRGAIPAADPETAAPVLERGFALYELGTGEVTYTGIIGTSSAVDVSPDGTKMVYVSTSTGAADTVHVANVDGSDVQVFDRTNAAGEAVAPRWSPDGTKVVYQGKPSSDEIGNLFVLDVTTGRSERITDLDTIEAGLWWMAPTFSFDGQTVFFNKPRRAGIGTTDTDQHWDVWSVSASGGEPTLIRRNAFAVDVSPAGNAIVYSEPASGEIYVARPDGTNARKIADGPSEIPRWSPDGSQIAYTDAGGAIRVLDVDTGDINDQTGAFGWAEWVGADTLMVEMGDA
jgi:Tol biopolymer transport system component